MRFFQYLGVWVFIFSFSQELIGQILVQGTVSDENNVAIAGAHISTESRIMVTDDQGYFQIELATAGVIEVSHVNFETQYIMVSQSQILTIQLLAQTKSLDELQIEAATIHDVLKVDPVQISNLNSLFGENDILKYLVTLPGVSSINSFDAGISVRGGSTTENAFLIDGIRIAEPKHMTMLVTAFDPYVLSQSDVYKSGYPSIYNGKLSGYVDMIGQPNYEKGVSVETTLGIISSSAKTSLAWGEKSNHNLKLSGRYSYLGLVAKMYERTKKLDEIPNYQLGDLTLSYHGVLSDKWSVNAYGLASSDDLPLHLDADRMYQMNWNNQSGVVSIDRALNQKGRLTFQIGGNRSATRYQNKQVSQRIDSEYNNQLALIRLDQPILNQLTVSLGYKSEWTQYRIINGEAIARSSQMDNHMHSVFGDATLYPNPNLTIMGGANLTYYLGEVSLLDLSPRFKIQYLLNRLELWVDYARTRQYEEMLPFFTVRSPIDIPVPLGSDNQSAWSDQVSIGASHQLISGMSLTASVFFKNLKHIKDFSAGSRANLEFESITMIEGKGYVQGIEAEWTYNIAKIEGRINYTYLNSKRQFDQINGGVYFSPPFDITSNILISLLYRLNQHWSFSAFWTYSSGIYVTVPEGVTVAKDITDPSSIANYIPIYGDRYNYRLPPRHRLDLGINYYKELKRKNALKISGGTFNTYNRKNADFVYFEVERKDDFFVSFVPKSKMVLPLIPYLSVTYYLNHKAGSHE
ncbi:TonB-dependent receptor [Reichenbachiella agarivorans]|uniref:TonB-dependent receptor n=1 Tax=Reichenbachiella agarivorans TaxID=2979464 RepID=A0ABY6CRU7_9BACT|nr:TonB-dependent receptor [Reichenbachiella agarivorans]UXP33226.1 TonB-dependent receptor [Reichenbachiella agarivorans]